MRALFAVVALSLVAGMACGSLPQTPAASSPSGEPALNVHGTIDGGSTLPCPPGEVCDPPITAMFVVFSQPGKPDIRTQTDGSGEFAVHLDPGSYSISAAPPPMNGRLQPSDLRVPNTGSVLLHLVVVRPPA